MFDSITGGSDRYIVYSDPGAHPRRLSILDTKRITHQTYTLPADCFTYAGGQSVGAGHSIIPCTGRNLLMDLRSGQFTSLDPPAKYGQWEDVGQHWISGYGTCPPSIVSDSGCSYYRNRTTGETRVRRHYIDPPLDLNSRDLTAIPRTPAWKWKVFFKDTQKSYNEPEACPRFAYARYRPSRQIFAWKTPNLHGARCINEVIHTKYAIVVGLIHHTDRTDSLEDYYYRLVVARLPR